MKPTLEEDTYKTQWWEDKDTKHHNLKKNIGDLMKDEKWNKSTNKWKQKLRLSYLGLRTNNQYLLSRSDTEDNDMSFTVVHFMKLIRESSWALSIVDGCTVSFGPVVTCLSPLCVTGNLWWSNLHAIVLSTVTYDEMGDVMASSTPHGSKVLLDSKNVFFVSSSHVEACFVTTIITALCCLWTCMWAKSR